MVKLMGFDESVNGRLSELDSTAGSAAEDRFEDILKKIVGAGAEVEIDEESPLFYDAGNEEIEIGKRRLVQFNVQGKDFQITRDEKRRRILGVAHKRKFEDLERPIIEIKLKSKGELEDQWVGVDLNALF